MKLVEAVNESNVIVLKDILSSCAMMIPIMPMDDEAFDSLFMQLHELGFEWSSGNSLVVIDKRTGKKEINNYSPNNVEDACYYIYKEKAVTYGCVHSIDSYSFLIIFRANNIIRKE